MRPDESSKRVSRTPVNAYLSNKGVTDARGNAFCQCNVDEWVGIVPDHVHFIVERAFKLWRGCVPELANSAECLRSTLSGQSNTNGPSCAS